MLQMDAAVHTADQPAAPPALVSRPRGTSGGMGLKQVITRVEKMTATILGKGIRNACPSRQRDASCWIPSVRAQRSCDTGSGCRVRRRGLAAGPGRHCQSVVSSVGVLGSAWVCAFILCLSLINFKYTQVSKIHYLN